MKIQTSDSLLITLCAGASVKEVMSLRAGKFRFGTLRARKSIIIGEAASMEAFGYGDGKYKKTLTTHHFPVGTVKTWRMPGAKAKPEDHAYSSLCSLFKKGAADYVLTYSFRKALAKTAQSDFAHLLKTIRVLKKEE